MAAAGGNTIHYHDLNITILLLSSSFADLGSVYIATTAALSLRTWELVGWRCECLSGHVFLRGAEREVRSMICIAAGCVIV
jgi:hypothetical protein